MNAVTKLLTIWFVAAVVTLLAWWLYRLMDTDDDTEVEFYETSDDVDCNDNPTGGLR